MDRFAEQVDDFNQAFGLLDHRATEPSVPPAEVNLLRIQCLVEEIGELAHALAQEDKAETLDALVDLQYFLSGTVLACGMHHVFEEAFAVVHAANMAKLDADGNPIRDASGRVVKPEGWVAPDLNKFVEEVW